MKELEKLIEKAYKNGKKINIEELFDWDFKKEEFETVSNLLESKGIKIEVWDEDAFEKIDCSDNSLRAYFLEIKKYPLLKLEEEKELIKLYKKGSEEAKEKLICSNLRFVVYVAKNYKFFNEYTGAEMLDLIQYGNIGLIKAIENFDLEKNNKLSTLAYWHIKNEIQKGLYNNETTIRVPVRKSEKLSRINKFRNDFEIKYGREPKEDEYATALNYSVNQIRELLSIDKNIRKTKSLNGELNKNDPSGDTLMEFAILETVLDESEKALSDIFASDILKISKEVLTPKQFKIFLERVGINENGDIMSDGKTLTEIGKELNLTRERVRKILKSSTAKIKRKIKQY